MEVNEVLEAARDSQKNGADRVAIVTSGKTPDESDFDTMLDMIKALNKEGIKSCASIGILNENQAKKLAETGLVRFHHNINTCRSYHPEICTTHTYEDRINTAKLVKKYGMELCCGVIIGMGESIEQRIEMALELAEINPDSIPVNILTPIPNTPFADYGDKIDEENILRTLAIFKIACPEASIRIAGGKKARLSEETIEKAFRYCTDSTIVGNYLTTTGFTPDEDEKLIYRIGRKLKKMSLFKLFLIFVKIGAILLGGGYVILPIMTSEFVDKRNLVSHDDLINYFALAQSLPGIIAANISMFIGYKLRVNGGL